MSAGRAFEHVLIANRGEVAVRIARAAARLGLRSCAVYAEDDADGLHRRAADQARPLVGHGPAAYLDAAEMVKTARAAGCDAIHPGYGFLSESGAFARLCSDEGIIFVGPDAATLDLFGDKLAARRTATDNGLPVAAGTPGPVTLEEAHEFLESLGADGAVMVKAVGGGGGRGMRVAATHEDLDVAFARAQSEIAAAFSRTELFVEELVTGARHVEVQIVGDGTGEVVHVWDRDCSIQRRHQKLIEVAPAPGLSESVRARLLDAAVQLGRAVRYRGLGTVEFLCNSDGPFVFLEANPRLQVEHTVTEAVTGIDLVRTQLQIARGARLADLGLVQPRIPEPRGIAIQLRVNAETVLEDGSTRVETGTVEVFEPPSGPGVRVDTACYTGLRITPRYDSLVAKIVVHEPETDLVAAIARADRALSELRVVGPRLNTDFLRALLHREEFVRYDVTTTFVESRVAELVGAAADALWPVRHAPPEAQTGAHHTPRAVATAPAGTVAVEAPTAGIVVAVSVEPGDDVQPHTTVLVVEAMKMEHVVRAGSVGRIALIVVGAGDTVERGDPVAFVEPGGDAIAHDEDPTVADLDAIRPDLAAALQRQALTRDDARPDRIADWHRRGRRTARENIEDLTDPGSFVEYGSLAIASMRQRRPLADLIATTPADGLVAGLAHVNGGLFPASRSRCAILSYDYTVLAGTQGLQGHRKKDRMFELIERLRLPVVLFAEGGGGRPGETDYGGVGFGDTPSFALFAQLSGLVPTIGIAAGRCFAGNAALLGCCDVIIATESATIGMAGPAMIEAAGLGAHDPESIGPARDHARNGVIDVLVADDTGAVAAARKYLAFFQGAVSVWEAHDQRTLRALVPENRKQTYNIRKVIEVLVDIESGLELRPMFGTGIVTVLARIEGRTVGVIANNPTHLGGAIDADSADKAARFLQLCDSFDLPIVTLCDTPGFMVGPEAERNAQVRHFARLFLAGASLSVPFFTIVLRKGYGLGAIAMAGGSWRLPMFTAAWPSGEFGGMGLEGAVRLGFRDQLDAIADPEQRRARYDELVAEMYDRGAALNAASFFEIDDVIDPASTRQRIASSLRLVPDATARPERKRTYVDSW